MKILNDPYLNLHGAKFSRAYSEIYSTKHIHYKEATHDLTST